MASSSRAVRKRCWSRCATCIVSSAPASWTSSSAGLTMTAPDARSSCLPPRSCRASASSTDMAIITAPATEFREKYVDTDGFRIRYLEAGTGTPPVHFHGAGGLHLYPSHELLAHNHR